MAGDKHSKTEKPTPKKKKDARKDGQIAKSRDISMWAAVLVGSYLIPSVVRSGARHLEQLWAEVATVIANPDEHSALGILGKGFQAAVLTVLPLALAMVVLGIVVNVAQVGFTINRKALKPTFSRINPLKGAKNLFSSTGAVNALKSIVKLIIVGLVAWQTFRGLAGSIVAPGVLTSGAVASLAAQHALHFIRIIAPVGIFLGLLDWAWQRRRIGKKLMMTKQEVKDEMKQSEGSPEIKGAIRKRQFKMSRLRMMAEVARADAVIVNPTHVSVAIRYELAKGAPRVVAKGADDVALAIREEAARHQVPLIEDIPLARTLWDICEPGDEIPVELYEAVARVLAFLFRVKASGRLHPLGGGPLKLPAPAQVGRP
jgi:flagellar biosynthetic protein FlhB